MQSQNEPLFIIFIIELFQQITCFSFLNSSVRFKTSVKKGLFWGTLPLNLCTRFIMIIGYVSGIQFKITIGRKTLFLSGQVIKVTVFL